MFRYYIFCICFFQLASIVNSYTLLKRARHTASYVDNKIYFLGGSTEEKERTNDFFYLDVSKPFTLDSDLPIVDLSSKSLTYNHAIATSSVCGPNKDTIFLFGGEFDDNTAPLVFAYKTSNPVWAVVNDKGPKPMRRRFLTSTCDKNAKIYSFGGSIFVNNVVNFYNNFDILDTNQLIWSSGSNLNIPPVMDANTASLLPDGRIVYLGGNNMNIKFVGFSEIYIYDTNNDKWSTMVSSGASPEARIGHTAVLTLDGRIIVYGGILEGSIPTPDPLLVLDTTVQPFKWSIPNVDFTPSFVPTWLHTATLVGNYMIVAFGHVYTNKVYVFSNQIFMLDVSNKDNYEWVIKFTLSTTISNPTQPTPSSTPPALSQPPSLGAIIGGTIGGIVVMVIGIFIIFLLYRRNTSKNKNVIPTPDVLVDD